MHEFILLSIAHVIAVASPGADFAVVLKNTLQSGKKSGLLTAIGVGCGISIHLIYTLFGIALILSQSESLFTAVKIIGAFYLLWIAWQAFHSRAKKASKHSHQSVELTLFQSFRQGFLTNVFNPKVTIFFMVLFTSIVSQSTPILIQSLYGLWLVIYTMLWFMFVAWVFSREQVLVWYETHGHYIDWGMGVFLSYLAVSLFW
ncbi:MAG: LysE family transporter [Gammaproteobacteria bacterium]|nr:LysE family transporter [Gammaproteobacteria bacterium]